LINIHHDPPIQLTEAPSILRNLFLPQQNVSFVLNCFLFDLGRHFLGNPLT